MIRRQRHKNGPGLLPETERQPEPRDAEVELLHQVAAAPAPGSPDERAEPYAAFYRALSFLREEFHRIGRFDDANAKLEEMCKLLAAATLDRRHPLPDGSSRLTRDHLVRVAHDQFNNPDGMAAALHAVYDELATAFPSELAAFGGRPGLSMAADDDEFANALVPLLASLPHDHWGDNDDWSFDAVNEAFGHFVQDSFRNRKEDAQYMTPPEVVTPLVSLAIDGAMRDVAREIGPDRPFRVADPTCGVGSFLASAYRKAAGVTVPSGRLVDFLLLIGQDKVDRMVRLANVNLRVFARAAARVRSGNSILPTDALDDLTGSIDLILTNPPFGAEFPSERLLAEAGTGHYRVLHEIAAKRGLPKVVSSEYILLDRGLALLRPGGRLLIVVPDHVVSGSGFSEDFRNTVRNVADLEAVFDLPVDTFAQAGTRTRTSVIYLRRKAKNGAHGRRFIAMATADDLGFRVKSRTGATVKQIVGANDMEPIVKAIRDFHSAEAPTSADIVCLSERPSVAAVADSEVRADHWNAGFYRTTRLLALQQLKMLESRGFQAAGLDELAHVDPPSGGRATAEGGYTCISVLHVREDGPIDLHAARQYRPTTACVPCMVGDVLFSRINPHIMRVCVVPDVGDTFACSAEFAILRPRPDQKLSAASLALLLRTEVVQAQVRTLTSGTSSSHSRIKPRELRLVRIPVPSLESAEWVQLQEASTAYSDTVGAYYDAICRMHDCGASVDRLMAGL